MSDLLLAALLSLMVGCMAFIVTFVILLWFPR